jgi:hypothetical protein
LPFCTSAARAGALAAMVRKAPMMQSLLVITIILPGPKVSGPKVGGSKVGAACSSVRRQVENKSKP